jgi:aerobic C4-dicarboxylate transport protein
VAGIAGMESMRSVGRIGVKALIYFEALTTIALILGLAVVNVVRPGEGVNATAPEVSSTVSGYIS